MTFLNSAILLGLLAGAIPIIIHFLTRQKAKTILFSSLRFLKKLENQQIRRLRLKQILLLIIRTLAILLLVFAFARPTIKGAFFKGFGSSAKTSAVIILDNSMSMGVETNGQQLFEIAKKKVSELGEVFNVGDEIFALYPTANTNPIYQGARYNFESVNQIVQKSKLTEGKSDLIAALKQAKNILAKTQNVNREIYLISDLQESTIDKKTDFNLPVVIEDDIRLFVIPVRTELFRNLVVTQIKPANQIIEKGKVMEMLVQVKNTGTKPARNKLLQIFTDGKRSGQATINLEPGEVQTVKFKIVPSSTGMLTGSVLLEDDDLFLDNRRYFTLYVPDQIRVLLVSKSEKDIQFLRLALNPTDGQISRIKTEFLTPEKIEFGTLSQYQVVILSNVPRIDGSLLSSIKDYVKSGNGLIVFPGSDIDLRNYNENFLQELSLPSFVETVGEIGTQKFNLSIGKVDFSHPIFSGVFEDKKYQFESPLFFFLTRIKVEPEHEIILKYSNDEPLLVESNFGEGKIFMFTSSLDPGWSDLYLKGIFVPLVNRCVAYLGTRNHSKERDYYVQEEVSALISGVKNYSDLKIKTPDGNFLKVIPKVDQGNLKIVFNETNNSGIYTLYNGENVVTKWAVNINPVESDLKQIPEDEVKQIFGNCYFISSENQSDLARSIKVARYGRELWKYFVGVALLLLIIEMILARESGEKEVSTEYAKFERA